MAGVASAGIRATGLPASCDHVWSIEALLGQAPDGPIGIVTCELRGGPAYLVRIDPATATEIGAALGLGAGSDGS